MGTDKNAEDKGNWFQTLVRVIVIGAVVYFALTLFDRKKQTGYDMPMYNQPPPGMQAEPLSPLFDIEQGPGIADGCGSIEEEVDMLRREVYALRVEVMRMKQQLGLLAGPR
jgi:hypothetical protein